MRTIVTGASGAVGRAIVGLLDDDLPRSRGWIIQASRCTGTDLTGDLGIAADEFGAADALVNCAGVAVSGLLATASEEDIRHAIEVNLLGTIRVTRAYVRARLARNRPGNVVTVGSVAALTGFSGLTIYSATKAGIDGFTRALAREMGPKGWRANVVHPGFLADRMAGVEGVDDAAIVRRTPLGRLGTAEDVARVVRWLLSEESSFVTGQSIVVDGGASC